MPISFSGNRITVTYIAGDTKGDSLVNAYTFEDIYNASVAGGWNVTKEDSQYYIPYSLYITGATFFKCNNVSVNIEGTVDIITFYIDSTGETELLNSRFYAIVNRDRLYFRVNGLISNCIISGFFRHTMLGRTSTLTVKDSVIDWLQIFYQQTNCVLEDVRFTRLDNGLAPTGAGWSQDGLEFMNSESVLYWLSTADFTVRNLKVKNVLFNTTFYVNTDSTGNLIDCENDPVVHRVVSAAVAGTRTNIANFQSTFRWLLEQKDVSVKVYDKDDNLVLDKVVNSGDEDVLTFAKRTVIKVDSATATTNTLETFEPFKAVLTKEGYQTFSINIIVVTRGVPTIIRGSLLEITESMPMVEIHDSEIHDMEIN